MPSVTWCYFSSESSHPTPSFFLMDPPARFGSQPTVEWHLRCKIQKNKRKRGSVILLVYQSSVAILNVLPSNFLLLMVDWIRHLFLAGLKILRPSSLAMLFSFGFVFWAIFLRREEIRRNLHIRRPWSSKFGLWVNGRPMAVGLHGFIGEQSSRSHHTMETWWLPTLSHAFPLFQTVIVTPLYCWKLIL